MDPRILENGAVEHVFEGCKSEDMKHSRWGNMGNIDSTGKGALKNASLSPLKAEVSDPNMDHIFMELWG